MTSQGHVTTAALQQAHKEDNREVHCNLKTLILGKNKPSNAINLNRRVIPHSHSTNSDIQNNMRVFKNPHITSKSYQGCIV